MKQTLIILILFVFSLSKYQSQTSIDSVKGYESIHFGDSLHLHRTDYILDNQLDLMWYKLSKEQEELYDFKGEKLNYIELGFNKVDRLKAIRLIKYFVKDFHQSYALDYYKLIVNEFTEEFGNPALLNEESEDSSVLIWNGNEVQIFVYLEFNTADEYSGVFVYYYKPNLEND